MAKNNQRTWQKQSEALRNPAEVVGASYSTTHLQGQALKFKLNGDFANILKKHKLTLLVTREYEHLLVALTYRKGKVVQSHLPLAHPSGIAVDRKNKNVYVVSSRNPNRIFEFKPRRSKLKRLDDKSGNFSEKYLIPTRVKTYPGLYYFHDINFIGSNLYGTAVGLNSVVKIDFSKPELDKPIWSPKVVGLSKSQIFTANFVQLNSIAAGPTLEKSFFSLSGIKKEKHRPGDISYPVDGHGAVISNSSKVVIDSLTRPHSARIIKGKIWVNNSGYGQVGYGQNGRFVPKVDLPGWTRGLCYHSGVLFVGISRILSRFEKYAPGIDSKKCHCGVYAIDIKSGQILGSIIWPAGNQIFAVEWISSQDTIGFVHQSFKKIDKQEISNYFNYII